MRNFSARETEWLQELDGIELSPFWRRAAAFALDATLVLTTVLSVALIGGLAIFAYRRFTGHPIPPLRIDLSHGKIHIDTMDGTAIQHIDSEIVPILEETLIPILYFGLLTWKGKGRTPGKRLLKIRVVSLVHRHLSLWHAIERALGYGAAALEGGFGFVQFFIHPYRRCVQDRIAETIVVTERGYQRMQSRSQHPVLPDEGDSAETRLAGESLSPEAHSSTINSST